MKPRVYLDTSVISALHDAGAPLRWELTLQCWPRIMALHATSSEVALEEIRQTPDEARRLVMLETLGGLRVFPLTQAMRELADRYLQAGLFTGRMESDALHVAAAVLDGCSALLSWNFKHLVNTRRRTAINLLNQRAGLPIIEIIVPPEV